MASPYSGYANYPLNDLSFDNQLLRDINRQEKSLGQLTEKFVELLKDSPDGILDLKLVSVFLINMIL